MHVSGHGNAEEIRTILAAPPAAQRHARARRVPHAGGPGAARAGRRRPGRPDRPGRERLRRRAREAASPGSPTSSTSAARSSTGSESGTCRTSRSATAATSPRTASSSSSPRWARANGAEIAPPEVISRGFAETDSLLEEAKAEAERTVAECLRQDVRGAEAPPGAHPRQRGQARRRAHRPPADDPPGRRRGLASQPSPQRKPVGLGCGSSGLVGSPGGGSRRWMLNAAGATSFGVDGWKSEARCWIWPRPGPSSHWPPP